MQALTPTALEKRMLRKFSANATCWSQATDEVRDMCREARIMAKVSDSEAADFNTFDTPAKWNTQGVAATIKFYRMLDPAKQKAFCERFENWITPQCIR